MTSFRAKVFIEVSLLELKRNFFRFVSASYYWLGNSCRYDRMLQTERQLTNICATLTAAYQDLGWHDRAAEYLRLTRTHLAAANAYVEYSLGVLPRTLQGADKADVDSFR